MNAGGGEPGLAHVAGDKVRRLLHLDKHQRLAAFILSLVDVGDHLQ